MAYNSAFSVAVRQRSKLAFAMVCILAVVATPTAQAITTEELNAISSTPYYNSSDTDQCTPSPTATTPVSTGVKAGAKVFVIGDSLTYGMVKLGGLLNKMAAAEAGYLVNTNFEDPSSNPPRISGPSVEATEGINITNTIPRITADHATHLAPANTDAIIIGLGTNSENDRAAHIHSLIQSIRTINSTAPIYWITTYYNSSRLSTPYTAVNSEIKAAANTDAFNVIDLATAIEAGTVRAPDSSNNDGIHYSGAGYQERSGFIVDQMKAVTNGDPNPLTTLTSRCCSENTPTPTDASDSPENNQAIAFNYFTGKGYTPAQASGIIGNMMSESRGVIPKTLQGIFNEKNEEDAFKDGLVTKVTPGDNGAVSSADVSPTTGKGFGIVQWTPASKYIKNSHDAGIDYATIDSLQFQLDFVWGQMTKNGLGGSILYQPGVDDKLRATNTAAEAAISFGRWFERFGGSEDLSNPKYTARVNNANAIFGRFSGGAATVATPSSCASAGAGELGWDLPGEGDHPMLYYSQMREASAQNPHDPAVTSFWGTFPYGPGLISNCGCGPTSFAMIVATLKNDPSITPDKVAAWAAENGHQMPSGTNPDTGENFACGGSYWWWTSAKSEEKWGVKARKISIDEAPALLRAGKLIMTSVGQGNPLLSKGSNGHLLVMRAVTEDNNFLFADPNDSIAHRKTGGDSGDTELFKQLGTSRTPLDAATVSNGLKALWVVEPL